MWLSCEGLQSLVVTRLADADEGVELRRHAAAHWVANGTMIPTWRT